MRGLNLVGPLMASPSLATIKRLYAVSGNRCAFPKCIVQLVDPTSGKVTGRIAHIKARQSGGPRYDAAQSEEQRHGFDNLLLLCPIHHDVVDDDPDSYTVERLNSMKSKHESTQQVLAEPGDAIANQFLASIAGNTVTHGSIIFTQNQMGGQVAHSIQNLGPQPRAISQAAANALIAELRRHPSEAVVLTCIMGDTEGHQLASVLKQVLKLGGWQVDGVNQAIFSGPVRNIQMEVPEAKPALQALLNWFGSAGLKPQSVLIPGSPSVKLIVGGNV